MIAAFSRDSLRLARVGSIFALAVLGAAAACTDTREPLASSRVTEQTRPLAWAPAGNSMSVARYRHSAAPLGGGRVLVCGGLTQSALQGTASCDVYTQGSGGAGSFRAVAPMNEERDLFTLTQTGPNSAVAVAGLRSPTTILGTAWTFAAGLGTAPGAWTELTPSLLQARRSHRTVAFPGGQLLVTGGVTASGGSPLDDERWNGTAWQNTTGIASRRFDHTATLLATGDRALVAGGSVFTSTGNRAIENAQIYTLSGNSWAITGSLRGPRTNHTATLLPDGDVLVAGGRSAQNAVLQTAERYRPSTGVWSDAGTMHTARAFHAAALLHGKVVVAGGAAAGTDALSSVEVYDPIANRWSDLDPLAVARKEHTLTVIDADHLLVAGGANARSEPMSSAEVLTAFPLGQSCDAELAECLSGYCVDGNCCESECADRCHVCEAGECLPISGSPRGGRPQCTNGYLCGAGACRTSCAADRDCQTDYYCEGGTCRAKVPQGELCSDPRHCLAGLPCVDNRCCNRDCAQCEACDEPGNLGICVAIVDGPRPGREPCEGEGDCAATCNGNDVTCRFAERMTACGAPSCDNFTETHRGLCDGNGTCNAESRGCGEFACDEDTMACRIDCTERAHCAESSYCENGTCERIPGLGTPCDDASECESQLCIDGVCCATECEPGYSCATPEQSGICRKPWGTPCADRSECGSSHCVDGVCCAEACSGQCEACGEPENEGKCIPVTGAPRNARPACDGGPASCDGADLLPAASCDGAGSCAVAEVTSCLGYRCNETADGAACPQRCDSTAECADDYTCRDGECVPGGSCEGDFTFRAANRESVDCLPYRCEPAGCRESCRSVADCAENHSCDRANGTCIPIAPPAASDDGCSCRLPGERGRHSSAWAALGALLLLRFRRARRAQP